MLAGDGYLQEHEIESVMRACITESGMEIPESDIQALTTVLYDEASNDTAASTTKGRDGINIDQLKRVFMRYPGLIENLNFRY